MPAQNSGFVSLDVLDAAVGKLKHSIDPADAASFESTTLQDVWVAIRKIQQEQRDRQSIRNLTRMKPLLEGLEKYAEVLGVLCNGTPYMPWIWAPIKLTLQLARGFDDIFEKLLLGYLRIGEALPRFDRFKETFKDLPAFQAVVMQVFEDIIEFHRRVYKFFRRRAWHIFFESLWKNFDARFDSILQSLKTSRDLVDQEALAIDIVEARASRHRVEADAQEREKRARIFQLQGAIAWLAVEGLQEDDLDQLLQNLCASTADWITSNQKVKSWIFDDEGEPILWLKGILGGGKSVISARLVQFCQDETEIPTLYFFFSRYINSNKLCNEVLRTLMSQLLRYNQDHALYIYTNYIQNAKAPSMVQLRTALRDILSSMPRSRIIIDGLDECQERDRKAILAELIKFTAMPETSCKILVSARDNAYASRSLRKMPTLCLTTECPELKTDIQTYVQTTMSEIFQEERFQGKTVEGVGEIIVNKGQGMFLWVRVVMEEMKHCQCVADILEGVENLPEGLHEVYRLILNRMNSELQGSRRDQATRVLEWIATSYRPLRVYELQDGVSLRPGQMMLDETTKVASSVIDVCRPLIQVGRDGLVNFVHFSVRKFLVSQESGPFINELKAHQNITFSCGAYLATSLLLVSSYASIEDRRERILKGLHGLHHYAHAFWIEHFLQYAHLLGSLDSTEAAEVITQVRRLLTFKKEDWVAKIGRNSIKIEPQQEDHERLAILSTVPDVADFVPEVLAFQQVLVQEDNRRSQKDLREYKLEHDPTYFTEILHFYQTTVEIFLQPLNSSQLDGFDKDRLKAFQEVYRHSAYACRYRLCPRTCDGFPTPLEREEHEAIHINHLKCRHPLCPNSATAFPSQFALQKHRNTFHRVVEKPIPKLRLPTTSTAESSPSTQP